MTQEIMDIVAKSLPAMQVDALRSELAKAARVGGLEADIKVKESSIRDLQAKLGAAEEKNRRIDSMEAKQAELDKKEQRLEVELLKKDVANKDYCIGMQKELMQCVFRNPTYTKSMSGTEPQTGGQYGGTVSTNRHEHITQD
jgi:hypothetical protein